MAHNYLMSAQFRLMRWVICERMPAEKNLSPQHTSRVPQNAGSEIQAVELRKKIMPHRNFM